MTTVTQQHVLPKTIGSLSTIDRPDYVDLFTASSSAVRGRSPEQLARAVLDRAAGVRGQFAWRFVLGLRLERRADRVAGWKIGDRGNDWLRLEAASRFLTAQVVVRVDGGRLWVSTFIHYDRPIAAVIWTPVAVVHRRAMPGLIRDATKVLEAS
jgi:hypothetical protein